jgi:hypothetical protein
MGHDVGVGRSLHAVVPDVAGPSRARRFVAETLRDWRVADRIDDAVLLTSELVIYAIEQDATPIAVDMYCNGRVVRVEVLDASPRTPVLDGEFQVLSGGIALVNAIADDWGCALAEAAPYSKSIWFRLDLSASWGVVAVGALHTQAPTTPARSVERRGKAVGPDFARPRGRRVRSSRSLGRGARRPATSSPSERRRRSPSPS